MGVTARRLKIVSHISNCPGARNVLLSRYVRPVPPTHVHHGPAAEKLFLALVTAPCAAANLQMSHYVRPVPQAHVRHGPLAKKMFLTLVTAPGAANLLTPHHVNPVNPTLVCQGPTAQKILVTAFFGCSWWVLVSRERTKCRAACKTTNPPTCRRVREGYHNMVIKTNPSTCRRVREGKTRKQDTCTQQRRTRLHPVKYNKNK